MMAQLKDMFWGDNCFDELKKCMKHSNEVSKELSSIFHERCEIENNYAKSLGKLSGKVEKLAKDSAPTGNTVSESLMKLTIELRTEGETHGNLSQANAELSKEIKILAEGQTKTRKQAEQTVAQCGKALKDRTSEQLQCKKNLYSKSKEAEQMHTTLNSIQNSIKEKEAMKMTAKCKKADEVVLKSDLDFIDSLKLAERARNDWEKAMTSYAMCCQQLEEARIKKVQAILGAYSNQVMETGPRITQSCSNLQKSVSCIDAESDLQQVAREKGTGEYEAIQILYDCYEEDVSNAINKERRKEALTRKIQMFTEEIAKEKKAMEGLENLLEVYQNNPKYAGDEAMDDVQRQFANTNAMIDSLTASQYKLECALSSVEGQSRPDHQLGSFMREKKDKQGIKHSTLSRKSGQSLAARPAQQPPQQEAEMPAAGPSPQHNRQTLFFDYDVMCTCTAKYDYHSIKEDELSICQGEVINVYEKEGHGEGWWYGELKGKIGVFPCEYVEENAHN